MSAIIATRRIRDEKIGVLVELIHELVEVWEMVE
jgi:hypothetical protein